MALGSDWSPSGSKNLLGELKVARIVSEEAGGVFSGREIVAMVDGQRRPYAEVGRRLGSIEPGKRADLLVVDGQTGDPYDRLIDARESSVTLVVIDGVPRYGAAVDGEVCRRRRAVAGRPVGAFAQSETGDGRSGCRRDLAG